MSQYYFRAIDVERTFCSSFNAFRKYFSFLILYLLPHGSRPAKEVVSRKKTHISSCISTFYMMPDGQFAIHTTCLFKTVICSSGPMCYRYRDSQKPSGEICAGLLWCCHLMDGTGRNTKNSTEGSLSPPKSYIKSCLSFGSC